MMILQQKTAAYWLLVADYDGLLSCATTLSQKTIKLHNHKQSLSGPSLEIKAGGEDCLCTYQHMTDKPGDLELL